MENAARLRMNYGDDDTPIEAAAIRRQKLCEVAGLVANGMTIKAAASMVGVPLPKSKALPPIFAYTPTPEQIAAECERIRSTWSKSELQSRVVAPLDPRWRPQEIAVADLGAA